MPELGRTVLDERGPSSLIRQLIAPAMPPRPNRIWKNNRTAGGWLCPSRRRRARLPWERFADPPILAGQRGFYVPWRSGGPAQH